MGRGSNKVFSLAAVAAGMLATSTIANAAQIEFASFDIPNANQPFSWVNTPGAGPTGTMLASSPDVQFTFTNQSGFPSTYDATMTISSGGGPTTLAPATPGFIDQQPLNQPLYITFTNNAITAGNPGYNLLTVSVLNGDLYGVDGSTNGTTAGQDGINGGVVSYSSDYGNFPATGNSFVLGLNTLSNPIGVNADGILNSFIANVDGQFSSDVSGEIHNSMPEPASLGLLGVMSIGLLAHRRRRTP